MSAVETRPLLAELIVALTLVGVALGRYPWLRMNRASIALVGATALAALGAPPLGEALRSIDLNTLGLLFGMMVINVNLRFAGFFEHTGSWIARHASTPGRLLALLIGCSGVLSALLLNDTIVLAFTPLVITTTRALGRPPVPYLVALVTAANVGSVATITGKTIHLPDHAPELIGPRPHRRWGADTRHSDRVGRQRGRQRGRSFSMNRRNPSKL